MLVLQYYIRIKLRTPVSASDGDMEIFEAFVGSMLNCFTGIRVIQYFKRKFISPCFWYLFGRREFPETPL